LIKSCTRGIAPQGLKKMVLPGEKIWQSDEGLHVKGHTCSEPHHQPYFITAGSERDSLGEGRRNWLIKPDSLCCKRKRLSHQESPWKNRTILARGGHADRSRREQVLWEAAESPEKIQILRLVRRQVGVDRTLKSRGDQVSTKRKAEWSNQTLKAKRNGLEGK